MKPLILLIGGINSGKSTIISSLTGCPSHNFRELVRDRSTGRQIYVISSSPQEDSLSQGELDQILETVHRRRRVIGLVISIQPTYPRTRLSLENIIQTVQVNSHFTIFAFILDPPYSSDGSIDLTDTINRLASFGVVSRYLDGRRFAYLNASDIRQIVGVP
ncbi:MAG: hypothetical protein JW845_03520 [Dehalococcoidales bacterium]|nr:hypothetical protein [Dehalococcoidales bacterium]